MELIVNASSSSGNSYLLKSSNGILALEAGVPLKAMLSNDINTSDIIACIVTHEHGDHAKYVSKYAYMGIDIYASQGTLDALSCTGHRYKAVKEGVSTMIGDFRVTPFNVVHDAREPLGFIIDHPESGRILFLTDTWYCPFKFDNLCQLIVEANYDDDILTNNLRQGSIHSKVFSRVKESHMELKVLQELLRENNLTAVNNIILIHLSSQNSDSVRFQKEIHDQTGKSVWVAEKGMRIPFSKTPF